MGLYLYGPYYGVTKPSAMSQRNQPHQQNGIASELKIQSTLTEHGFIVSKPIRDCAYDIVVEVNGYLRKVQIKRGYACQGRDNVLRINIYRNGRAHEGEKRPYKEHEVDAFIIHNPIPDEDEFYWLWFDETPEMEMKRKFETLRDHQLVDKLTRKV